MFRLIAGPCVLENEKMVLERKESKVSLMIWG